MWFWSIYYICDMVSSEDELLVSDFIVCCIYNINIFLLIFILYKYVKLIVMVLIF